MAAQEIALSRVRWLIAAATSLYQVAAVANLSYGVVNDVYAEYFGVTYAQVDLILTGGYMGSMLVIPFLAWLSFRQKIKLRRLLLVGAGCLTLGLGLLSSSFLHPSLFGLAVFGNILTGIGRLLSKTIISTLAVLWFADNEVGTVMGLSMFGSSLGGILGTGLMGYIVDPETPSNTSSKQLNASEGITNLFGDHAKNSLGSSVKSLFLYYIAYASVAAFIFLFYYFFVTDLPPKPPTHAQSLKRVKEEVSDDQTSFVENLRSFLDQMKRLFSDGTFLMLAFCWGLYLQTYAMEIAFLGEIIRATKVTNPYAMTSWILISYGIGGMFGAGFGGKLVDRYKNYVVTLKVANLCSVFATALVAAGVFINQVWFVLAFNAVYAVFARICFVAVMEIITQHTYPMDVGFVNLWVVFIDTLYGTLITELGRFVYNYLGGFAVLILQSLVMFIGSILTWTARVKLQRLEVEKSETSRLLEGRN